jgi:hypothetical protein
VRDAVDAVVIAAGRLGPVEPRLDARTWGVSMTSVDLPEPETPVAQVSSPSGKRTFTDRRLLARALRTVMYFCDGWPGCLGMGHRWRLAPASGRLRDLPQRRVAVTCAGTVSNDRLAAVAEN